MNITIFGFNLNLEVLILIGIIYLILAAHTFCGCCNTGNIIEALTTIDGSNITQKIQQATNDIKSQLSTVVGNKTESFVGANTNYGQSSPYKLGDNSSINANSWNASSMVVTPGQPYSSGVKSVLGRPTQPTPLPENEMLMFANTNFKPECCPNTYTNSTGCACMTTNQYNYLVLRGGNNVPYSQY